MFEIFEIDPTIEKIKRRRMTGVKVKDKQG
jgi:hypothetical protein